MKPASEIFIGLIPGLSGLALYSVALLDIELYQNGEIDAREAIMHEVLFFFLGLFATLFVIGRCSMWQKQKEWKLLALGVISVLSYFVFFALAGREGAAILYAT